MAYITRVDGEHFVVPAYRDILSVKKTSLLKKEILLLSQKYGNYNTLQQKNKNQFEVAFSNDTGYLLGESIWSFFKKPANLIYCEAISGTNDALLVIVKSGSVYLDGSFPIDSIADELLIFKTETLVFDVYIYGNVPISESTNLPNVKKFVNLPEAIFPTLPLLNEFKLLPTDVILKKAGIGVFPLKKFLAISLLVILIPIILNVLTTEKKAPEFVTPTINPWQGFFDSLNLSPNPSQEIIILLQVLEQLFNARGWTPLTITYSGKMLTAKMDTQHAKLADLMAWAKQPDVKFNITISPQGIFASHQLTIPNRKHIASYMSLQYALTKLIDRINAISVGLHISLNEIHNKSIYNEAKITIFFDGVSVEILNYIATQIKDLPLILDGATFDSSAGSFTGNFTFRLLGK